MSARQKLPGGSFSSQVSTSAIAFNQFAYFRVSQHPYFVPPKERCDYNSCILCSGMNILRFVGEATWLYAKLTFVARKRKNLANLSVRNKSHVISPHFLLADFSNPFYFISGGLRPMFQATWELDLFFVKLWSSSNRENTLSLSSSYFLSPVFGDTFLFYQNTINHNDVNPLKHNQNRHDSKGRRSNSPPPKLN